MRRVALGVESMAEQFDDEHDHDDQPLTETEPEPLVPTLSISPVPPNAPPIDGPSCRRCGSAGGAS